MEPGIAWIIGGGSGIGAEVAKLLAQRGWTVAVSGRRTERLEEVAAGYPQIKVYPLDVTDELACSATISRVAGDLGRIDLFLYSVAAAAGTRVGDYEFSTFTEIVDANFLGLVRVLNAVVAQMERQGGGQIAVMASLAGYFGLPHAAAYSATKAALISLCETMRTELAPKHITVRMIAPGYVKSDFTARNSYPMPFLMETDHAARLIVKGIFGSKRFEIAFPWQMVLAMKAIRLLPYPLFFALMAKLMERAADRGSPP